MKTIVNNKAVLAIACALGGLLLGWVFFHEGSKKQEAAHEGHEHVDEHTIWTCAMHPQIRQNEPGNCPICGMELIPLDKLTSGPNVVEMSESAARLANILTSKVSFMLPEKEINLQGKVVLDETRVGNQTVHIPGRIEKLYVDFTGEKVRKGQKLASIYSPELVNAQKELLEAAKSKNSNGLLYKAARNKLKQWKFTDAQINEIEKKAEVQEDLDILADMSGIVLERKVAVGDHVMGGGVLFTVADLSRVWVVFDAYEADIPWLKVGDEVDFTVGAVPGKSFSGKITFIDPVINAKTRTASVRLEIPNSTGELKPEMFANATVTAKLPIEEAYLTVPKSAVMWTGKRSVVYVAIPESEKPAYEFREVTLGPDLGGYYIIKDGLTEGDQVVTNGTFKVDAAAQLAGKKSMMNREVGDQSSAMGDMEGMEEERFTVSGNCALCKKRIESAAMRVAGVKHAMWNKDTKELMVHFDGSKTNKQEIEKAIAAAGHDTPDFKAPHGDYKDLPECCQYTRK